MERDEPSGDDAYVEARIPPEVRDRVEELFRRYRGYEPSTLQESLSVVCDLAEQRLDSTTDGRRAAPNRPEPRAPTARPNRERANDRNSERDTQGPDRDGVLAGASQSAPEKEAGADPAEEIRETIEEVFPTDWDADPESARLLPKVVNRYVSGTDASTRAERENAALSAVAAHEGTTSDALRETLIEGIYGTSTLPGDLASEFFSEALEKVERRIDDAQAEALSPIDLVDDVGGGSDPDANADAGRDVRGDRSDRERESPPAAPSSEDPTAELELGPESGDLPAGIADDVASDGGAVQSVDQRIDNLFADPNGLTEIGIESLVEGASADCEICGATRSVGELETTTEASGDRRVDLVCPNCVPE